ncbi:MAG: P-loop NTPase [Deltaproteobacteria bacterium]|nr:P-loop NTPase [Deltaproteobacteria bacterium]
MMPKLRGLSFHSAKGGAGKSTLATLAAVRAAQLYPESHVVLIDMDLTGTSLADVLRLQAPICRVDDQGRLQIHQEHSGFMSHDDSTDAIASRGDEDDPNLKVVPFLNDYLLFPTPDWSEETDALAESISWRLEGGPEKLRVIPSSALPSDLRIMVPIIFDEYHAAFLESRLEYLLANMLAHHGDVIAVIDVPPTIPGLSRAILSLGLRLNQRPLRPLAHNGGFPEPLESSAPKWTACVISTMDKQDLRAVDRWLRLAETDGNDGSIRVVLNNADGDESQTRALVSERLGQLYAQLWDDVLVVPSSPDFLIFRDGNSMPPEAQLRQIDRLLEETT